MHLQPVDYDMFDKYTIHLTNDREFINQHIINASLIKRIIFIEVTIIKNNYHKLIGVPISLMLKIESSYYL